MKNLADTRLRPTMPGCLARGKPMDRRYFLLSTIPDCSGLSDFLASSLVGAHDFGRGFRYLKRSAVDSAVEQTLGASIGAAMRDQGNRNPNNLSKPRCTTCHLALVIFAHRIGCCQAELVPCNRLLVAIAILLVGGYEGETTELAQSGKSQRQHDQYAALFSS